MATEKLAGLRRPATRISVVAGTEISINLVRIASVCVCYRLFCLVLCISYENLSPRPSVLCRLSAYLLETSFHKQKVTDHLEWILHYNLLNEII